MATDKQTNAPAQPFMRRSATFPTRLQRPPQGLEEEEAVKEGAQTLFVHSGVKIVSFDVKLPRAGSSSTNEATEALPWASRTERIEATGPLRVYRAPNSVAFLNSGKFVISLMPRSQCWCVDGQSKFAMRIQQKIYRIELPYTDPKEIQKVEEFKRVLAEIVMYERTACPFKRGFTVDLPPEEQQDSPKRRVLVGPMHKVKQQEFDKVWRPEGDDSYVIPRRRSSQRQESVQRLQSPSSNGDSRGSTPDGHSRESAIIAEEEEESGSFDGNAQQMHIHPRRPDISGVRSVSVPHNVAAFEANATTAVPGQEFSHISSPSITHSTQLNIAHQPSDMNALDSIASTALPLSQNNEADAAANKIVDDGTSLKISESAIVTSDTSRNEFELLPSKPENLDTQDFMSQLRDRSLDGASAGRQTIVGVEADSPLDPSETIEVLPTAQKSSETSLTPSRSSAEQVHEREELNPSLHKVTSVTSNSSVGTSSSVATASTIKDRLAPSPPIIPLQRQSSATSLTTTLKQRPSSPSLRYSSSTSSLRRYVSPPASSRPTGDWNSNLISRTCALLMSPPSSLIAMLMQFARRIADGAFGAPNGQGRDGGSGWNIGYRFRLLAGTIGGTGRQVGGQLPGTWGAWEDDDQEDPDGGAAAWVIERDDEDEHHSDGEPTTNDDDEDDYGVPLGNETPARRRRARLGGGSSDVD